MKPKNTICLGFEKDAHAAARFYSATFPDSKVTAVHEAPSDYPGGKKGDPLIVDGEKVVPNITKVFRRRQNLYVTFDVYDAKPDPGNKKSRRVKVSMSLFNAKGMKTFEAGPIAATDLATTRPNAVPFRCRCR